MGITQQRNLLYLNVKDYGATGNGTTDDTAAITAAIAAANSAGGGGVFFPAGTYLTTTQLLYSNVHLRGAGPDTSILKLKNGTNSDLLQGSVNGYSGPTRLADITAASGTGITGGVANWSIEDMTLDGNQDNQTGGPSYCIRVYGYHYRLCHISVRNGYSGGIYSDWNGGTSIVPNPGISTNNDDIESFFTDVQIHNNGNVQGNGLTFAGPHDTKFSGCYIFRNGQHNVHIGPNATGTMWNTTHLWGARTGINAVGFLIEAGYTVMAGVEVEGTDTCCIVSLASTNTFEGVYLFGNGIYSMSAFQLGQAAGQTPFPGQVNQSAGLTTAVSVANNRLRANIFRTESTNGAIVFANDAGNNNLEANMYLTAGAPYTGSPNKITKYLFPQGGTIVPTVQLSSETPWALFDGDMSIGGTSVAGANNSIYLVNVTVPVPVVLTGIRVRFGAGGAGHYDVGIYDSSGALKAHAASSATALPTQTGTLTPALIGGNVYLPAGKYQMALWIDNVTDTIFRASTGGGSSMIMAPGGTYGTGPAPANTSSITGLANGNLRPVLVGLVVGGWS